MVPYYGLGSNIRSWVKSYSAHLRLKVQTTNMHLESIWASSVCHCKYMFWNNIFLKRMVCIGAIWRTLTQILSDLLLILRFPSTLPLVLLSILYHSDLIFWPWPRVTLEDWSSAGVKPSTTVTYWLNQVTGIVRCDSLSCVFSIVCRSNPWTLWHMDAFSPCGIPFFALGCI